MVWRKDQACKTPVRWRLFPPIDHQKSSHLAQAPHIQNQIGDSSTHHILQDLCSHNNPMTDKAHMLLSSSDTS